MNIVNVFLLVTALFTLPGLVHASLSSIPLEAVNEYLDKLLLKKSDHDQQLHKKIDAIAKDISNFPPIENDFNALNSKDNRLRSDAAARIAARGDAASPYIVQMMASPKVSLREKKHLCILLAFINTPGTEANIIDFAEMVRGLDENARQIPLRLAFHDVFRWLSKYNDTSTAIDYANKLLGDKSIDHAIHEQALLFLADHDVKSAKKWAALYNTDIDHDDLQYAVLYLCGKYGLNSNTQETIEFLVNSHSRKKSHKSQTYLLFDNLVQTVPANQLREIIKTMRGQDARFLADDRIDLYPVLSELYRGDDEQRADAALKILSGDLTTNPDVAIESLEYMISLNDAAPYIDPWKLHNPVLRRFVAHLGYTIDLDANPPGFVKAADSYALQTPKPDGLVRLLLTSFVNNDVELFSSSVFPDMHIFAKTIEDVQGYFKEDRLDESYHEYKSNAINKWRAIYKMSSRGGFDWSDVEYKSHENSVYIGSKGTHFSTLEIDFEENGKTHTVVLGNCILYENKWYFLSRINW